MIPRRGFIMADIAIGMAVVGVIAAVLLSAVGRERAAEQRLADDRAAARLAERVLLDLQHHQPPPQARSDARITMRKTADPAGGNWTAVDVELRGRRATLIGMVPEQGAK